MVPLCFSIFGKVVSVQMEVDIKTTGKKNTSLDQMQTMKETKINDMVLLCKHTEEKMKDNHSHIHHTTDYIF